MAADPTTPSPADAALGRRPSPGDARPRARGSQDDDRPPSARGRAPEQLATERLLLRPWRAGDREPFATMNADPEVMRWIGSGPLDASGSDELRARLRREWASTGHGLWAIERTQDAAFLGFCGLAAPPLGLAAGLRGEIEIGWRLCRGAWGRGYASEAARAALGSAWSDLGLRRAVALVHPSNARSLAVGERLGMRVTGTTRHQPTGWELLVLRADRPRHLAPIGSG